MDVIAAIATGSAATAIGIVRVSGDGCFALCGRVFRAAGGRPFAAQEPRKMVFGEMLDRAGRVIDRGLAVRFPGPGSYTGEDCAEFHCHGSPVVLRELLSALFAAGARQAQAGEFTKRAFLNGRMDLTQAEAVVDLIDAETAAAARNAAAQLDGGLRRVLEPVQEELLEVTSRFYAVVDYPDEDIQDVRPEEIAAALRSAAGRLERLLELTRRLAGDPSLSVDEAVYRSEKQTGSRNRAMAFLLESCGLLHDDPEEVLDCYFRACSIRVDCRDLAHIACTFAGRGRRSPSGERLFPARYAHYVNAVLMTCGMYNGSGDFAVKVGLPAKSGVGGGIMAVSPARMGIGIYSPGLDEKGNSLAGIRLLEQLGRRLSLSIF